MKVPFSKNLTVCLFLPENPFFVYFAFCALLSFTVATRLDAQDSGNPQYAVYDFNSTHLFELTGSESAFPGTSR